MYRVELKDSGHAVLQDISVDVPNVPCGVESIIVWVIYKFPKVVPNVPCGVERKDFMRFIDSPS